MVKFDVKPSLTLRPDNSLSGTVKLTTEKWGNEFSATLADEMFKDGFSTTGLRLGVKANGLEVDYAVAGHKPKVTFRTAFPLSDRNVGIKYTHNIAARGSDVEASVPIDDDNKATIIYNLTDYNGPDHRNLILKWAHTQKDFTFEPAFNLNTESVQAKVTYQVDPENKLTASFDTHTRVGTLEWLNSANLGGEGDLKLTASSSLDPSDLGKKMPTLLLEKTFSLDA